MDSRNRLDDRNMHSMDSRHPYATQWPNMYNTISTSRLFLILLVNINDLLHLLVAAQEDARSVVDVLGHDLDHAIHVAVDGLSASCEGRQ